MFFERNHEGQLYWFFNVIHFEYCLVGELTSASGTEKGRCFRTPQPSERSRRVRIFPPRWEEDRGEEEDCEEGGEKARRKEGHQARSFSQEGKEP